MFIICQRLLEEAEVDCDLAECILVRRFGFMVNKTEIQEVQNGTSPTSPKTAHNVLDDFFTKSEENATPTSLEDPSSMSECSQNSQKSVADEHFYPYIHPSQSNKKDAANDSFGKSTNLSQDTSFVSQGCSLEDNIDSGHASLVVSNLKLCDSSSSSSKNENFIDDEYSQLCKNKINKPRNSPTQLRRLCDEANDYDNVSGSLLGSKNQTQSFNDIPSSINNSSLHKASPLYYSNPNVTQTDLESVPEDRLLKALNLSSPPKRGLLQPIETGRKKKRTLKEKLAKARLKHYESDAEEESDFLSTSASSCDTFVSQDTDACDSLFDSANCSESEWSVSTLNESNSSSSNLGQSSRTSSIMESETMLRKCLKNNLSFNTNNIDTASLSSFSSNTSEPLSAKDIVAKHIAFRSGDVTITNLVDRLKV